MIGGYACHGFAAELLKVFDVVRKLRVKPTCITFLGYNACGLS